MKAHPNARYAIEAAVIVASILIAFAIDTWWEGREEARSRTAILLALESDARAMRAEVDRVRSAMASGLEASRAFLALEDEVPLDKTQASRVDAIAAELTRAPSFDAPLGAAEALLSGGDLSFVENPLLVEHVTALLSQVSNLDREQRRIIEGTGELRRLVNDRGIDFTYILARLETFIGTPVPVRPRTTSLYRHVGDPYIRSLVLNNWARYLAGLSILDWIEAELDGISIQIDKVIDSP